MPELKIRDIDDTVVKLLDDIVAAEGYSSRHQLLVDIVTRAAVTRHPLFTDNLPPTVKYLCKESIAEQKVYAEAAMDMVAAVNIEVLEQLKKLISLFEPETIMQESDCF